MTFDEMVNGITKGQVSFTYPYLEIRESVIPAARLGVFTNVFIRGGSVVEVCPTVPLAPAHYPEGDEINDYIFHGAADDSKRYIIVPLSPAAGIPLSPFIILHSSVVSHHITLFW